MTAREFTVPGQNRFKVTGEGYATKGELLSAGGGKVDLEDVMLPMALCADARLDGEALIGDPTEGALIVLAEKGGISVDDARQMYPRVAEVPFDSDYKFMATFHEMKDAKGKTGDPLLRQGRARRPHRPRRPLLAPRGRRGADHRPRTASWPWTRTSAWPKRANG